MTVQHAMNCFGQNYTELYLVVPPALPHNLSMSVQTNLYERLADELGGLIASWVFAPGDRLPSIRHLSQQKRLSISTVMQALRLLEDRGLVDVRPQAGFYVRHRARSLAAPCEMQAAKDPTYVGINNLLMRVLKANKRPGVLQLGLASPPPDLLPIKRMQQTIAAVTRRSPDLQAPDGATHCKNVGRGARIFSRQLLGIDAARRQHALGTDAGSVDALKLHERAIPKRIGIIPGVFFFRRRQVQELYPAQLRQCVVGRNR